MITYIVATVGRPSLQQTLKSIECWTGDEIIVIGNVQTRDAEHVRCVSHPPGKDWGSTERNVAMGMARGRYLSHMDDDDVYAKGTRALLASAIIAHPDRPTLFRMRMPHGNVLWREKVIKQGNVGTPMIFTPNDPAKLGRFGEHQDCGDIRFLESMKWTADDIVWREDIIAEIGQTHV